MGAPSKTTSSMSTSTTDHHVVTKPPQQPNSQKAATGGGIRQFFLRRSTPPPNTSVTGTADGMIKFESAGGRETTERRRQSSSGSSPAISSTKKKVGSGLFWSNNNSSSTNKKDITSKTTSSTNKSTTEHLGLHSPSSGNSGDNLDVVLTKFANHFHHNDNHNNSNNVTERISSIRPIGQKSSGATSKKPIVIKPIVVNPTNNTLRGQGIITSDKERSPQPQGTSAVGAFTSFRDTSDNHSYNNNSNADDASIARQMIKERDGFCRRVDKYDGSVIFVEGKAAYELGNYLGGGVAGVVYEGHRLLPESEYPVRRGLERTPTVINTFMNSNDYDNDIFVRVNSLLSCVPTAATMCNTDMTTNTIKQQQQNCMKNTRCSTELCVDETPDTLPNDLSKNDSFMIRDNGSMLTADTNVTDRTMNTLTMTETVALEAVDNMILIDEQDAPSRSKHLAQAVTAANNEHDFPCDASFTNGFMEETVAIKILNPVGFRALSVDITNTAVVARRGAPYQPINPLTGQKVPMDEKHVWWLINPSSRNLRTLQRYSVSSSLPRGVEVDRGSPEKGLRISVVAAYQDPVTNQIKELPLTKCIEVWGHVPFEASDAEFREVMLAIENINQGLPPPPFDLVPGRVGTGTSSSSSLTNNNNEHLSTPAPMVAQRTGIYRAASTPRKTVFCEELHAYIALPSVPTKYLKWLRQRRAATKEIRNMMLIGRHRNVVHLFEVLELIQETKSTMFLILELVRGGELFDLISSNAAKISSQDKIPSGYTESETVMRKFFLELASGIHYCHINSIAHRDLKPENLLVHNGADGNCTLKIADFGLSSAFGVHSQGMIGPSDQDTAVESYMSGPPILTAKGNNINDTSTSTSSTPSTPIRSPMDKLMMVGSQALGFFTCGNVDDILARSCVPSMSDLSNNSDPSPLKRMTSVVGSPHYVAPEIIAQHDKRGSGKKTRDGGADTAPTGYDGTKADVWSAGVILYAMLFRSLPFGEDLLRCPRYQSFKNWYDEVKKSSGSRSRRCDLMAALNPIYTEVDKRDLLGPQWFFPSKSSPESRDLIVYMLNPDPDMRPNIQLVLQHPWLLKKAL